MIEEEWKSVVGFENDYQVSNLGNVRSIDRVVTYMQRNQYCKVVANKTLKGRILSPRELPSGYLRVQLKNKDYFIHRIVCASFIRPISCDEEVNHKDGNKANNKLSNLEIVSRVQNQNHAFDTGLNTTIHKSVGVCVNGIEYASLGEAERGTGIPKAILSARLRGKGVSPYKYIFEIHKV